MNETHDRKNQEVEPQATPGWTEAHKQTSASSAAAPAPARERMAVSASKDPEASTALFCADEAGNLRSQWDAIQVGFVDDPRLAVQEADSLVATAMRRLAEQFTDERGSLERQWDRGDAVSTEGLRLILRRYRSFFDRLLSV